MVGLLAWGYRRLLARVRPADAWRRVSFALALVLLWATLDWPLGPLGASYLASIHMVQFLAVGVAAPALLLLAVPPVAFHALERAPRAVSVLRDLTHPLTAFFLFNVVMTVTHWPGVVDALMPTQLGSFLVDASWLLAGLVFWWPLVAPVPDRSGFHPLGRIAYLGLNAFLIRPPFAMMVFSEHPIYAIYELAPPPGGDPMGDQQLAGVLMEVVTAWIMLAAVVVVFVRWRNAEGAGPR